MIVPLTPLDFLERAARNFSDLEAIVQGSDRWTYGQFDDRCRRLASLLLERGLRPGDRVAYLAPNTIEMLEAYYGVLLAGGVLVPLNIRLAPAELQFVLDDSGATMLAVHPSLAETAARLTAPAVVVLRDGYLAGFEPMEGRPVVDENAVCEIFYTSGTTGGPKGAMLTHRALSTHATDSALSMGCTHRDVVLHTIPLFHVNGWGTPHWVTLLGAKHVMLERFDAATVLDAIVGEGVTRLHLVPTMASMLVVHPDFGRADTSSLVQVTVGGAPPGADLLAELERGFGCEVICGYGLTEAAPQLTKALTKRSHDALSPGDQNRRRATTGLPNIGVELRVLGRDEAEVPWDAATPGEVCVRSNHVMAGYWNKPDATDEVLRGGWLRTGDIATVDGEGYLTIVDRKKDLIISGGENISSVEVEKAICAHPAVLEAAVVGRRDPRWGEVPMAYVVARPAQSVDAATLQEFLADRLAKFKIPKVIEVIDELPKSGTGKVLKTELRRRDAD
ncbi:MAG: long-chain-fatty-acid--CoA ligase [Acidimicrobiales bacterium]